MEKPTPRILVVDDEPQAIELLKRSLRKQGSVSAAGSGEEAWALLEEQSFDLVISDQRMPGTSGVELLEHVAELDDNVGRILLTGYSDMEATVDAINRGRVHAYLHKPIATEQLLSVVHGVLERVGLVREKLRLLAVVSQQRDRLREALDALQAASGQTELANRALEAHSLLSKDLVTLLDEVDAIRALGESIALQAAATSEPLETLGRQVAAQAGLLRQALADLAEPD